MKALPRDEASHLFRGGESASESWTASVAVAVRPRRGFLERPVARLAPPRGWPAVPPTSLSPDSAVSPAPAARPVENTWSGVPLCKGRQIFNDGNAVGVLLHCNGNRHWGIVCSCSASNARHATMQARVCLMAAFAAYMMEAWSSAYRTWRVRGTRGTSQCNRQQKRGVRGCQTCHNLQDNIGS